MNNSYISFNDDFNAYKKILNYYNIDITLKVRRIVLGAFIHNAIKDCMGGGWV